MMEQIPENSYNQLNIKQISDFEEFKSDFKQIIENLMKPPKKELKEEELRERYEIIQNSLIDKLSPFLENTYFNLLPILFEMIIETYIKKSRELLKLYFIPLEACYDIFLQYNFRIIPKDTIEMLIGALQWNTINPHWIDYNFMKNYFSKLHQKVPLELKIKTWNLVELTKIKQIELKIKR